MSNDIICNQARRAMGMPTNDTCPECFTGPCKCPRYEKPEQAKTGEKPYMWLGKDAEVND